jgi:hypothetical protein
VIEISLIVYRRFRIFLMEYAIAFLFFTGRSFWYVLQFDSVCYNHALYPLITFLSCHCCHTQILRNAGRVGAVSYVSGMVLVIGKLLISVLTTSLAYYFMVDYLELNLHSFAGPVSSIFVVVVGQVQPALLIGHFTLPSRLQAFS